MKKLLKASIIGIILLFGLLIGSKSTFAEENYGIHFLLGPTSQKISLNPGDVYRSSVYVSNPNDSKSDVKVVLYVTPYSITNDNYDPSFDQKTSYNQISDWITLDKTELTISPNQKIDVGFTITVPEDAPAGGQYASIMAQNVVEDDDKKSGMNITDITAISSVVVAEVAGKTREEGNISSNTIPSFLFSGPLEASSVVRNDGNIHSDASYVLQVWPLFSNEEICTNEEKPTTSIVLPDTEKFHTESCDNLPMIGILRAKQTIKLFDKTSITEKIVIVCPAWLLFIIIFVIVLLVLWIVARVKANKKREA